MRKHLILFIAAISASFFVGCSSDDDFTPPNYVTFEADNPVGVGVEIGGTSSHEVTVYTANVTSNDRTFDLVVAGGTTIDAAGYTIPATVTVPGGTNEGTLTVEVSDMNLGLTGKNLVFGIAGEDGLYVGKPYTITVTRTCEGTEFVADFEFDGYASEFSWSLENADGEVLVTGGGYEDGVESASRSLCLDLGSYTMTVNDSYGDGLTYPNVGSVTLSYAGEEFVVLSGDFGSSETVNFTLAADGATVDAGDTDGGDTDGGDTDGGDTDGGDA